MRRVRKTICIFLVLLMISSTALAEIPDYTVIIGNKAFALKYANDEKNINEIKDVIKENKGDIIIKARNKWYKNNGESFQDLDSLPKVIYTDENGNRSEYEEGNGDKIKGEILSIDVVDENTIQIKFTQKLDKQWINNRENYLVNGEKLTDEDIITYNEEEGYLEIKLHKKINSSVELSLKNVTNQYGEILYEEHNEKITNKIQTPTNSVIPPYRPIRVSNIVLNEEELKMEFPSESQLTAEVQPDNATNKDVIWKSSDENVVTVDENGKVVTVGVGEAVITAFGADGVSEECKVTVVNDYIEAEEIKLNVDEEVEIELPEQFQITAEVLPGEATNKTLTWKSSDENVATVDENGKVTSKGVGTAVITVEGADGTSATCTVTVVNNYIEAEEIKLNVNEVEIEFPEEYQLIAEVFPGEATNKTLTWKSSDENVATVDENGKVVATGVGTAVITVEGADGITTECNVTVLDEYIAVQVKEINFQNYNTFELILDENLDLESEELNLEVSINGSPVEQSGWIFCNSNRIYLSFWELMNEDNDRVIIRNGDVITVNYVLDDENKIIANGKIALSFEFEATCDAEFQGVESAKFIVDNDEFNGEIDNTNTEIIIYEDIPMWDIHDYIFPINANSRVTLNEIYLIAQDGNRKYYDLIRKDMKLEFNMEEYDIDNDVSIIILEEELINNTNNLDYTITTEGDCFEVVKGDSQIHLTPIKEGTGKIIIEGQATRKDGSIIIGKTFRDELNVVIDFAEAESIVLSQSELTLVLNETYKLTANILPENTHNKIITWASSDEKIATVDQNGNITAKGIGTTVISATTNNGKIAECNLTVNHDKTDIEFAGIEISDYSTINFIIEDNFDNTVILSDQINLYHNGQLCNKEVVFNNENSLIIKLDNPYTIVEGKLNFKHEFKKGDSFEIRYTANDNERLIIDGMKVNDFVRNIEITEEIDTIDGKNISIKDLTFNGEIDNEANKIILFSVMTNEIIEEKLVTPVDSKLIFIGEGVHYDYVSLVAKDGSNKLYTIVYKPFTFSFDSDNDEIIKDGEKIHININNPSNLNYTVEVEADNVVDIEKSQDQITVVGIEVGSTRIIIKGEPIRSDGSNVEGILLVDEKNIIVLPIPVDSIILEKEVTMELGEKLQLSPEIYPSNATDKKLTWVSSNPAIVSVDENGILTSKKLGSVVITAVSNNNKIATCVIKSVPRSSALFVKIINNKAVINIFDITESENIMLIEIMNKVNGNLELIQEYELNSDKMEIELDLSPGTYIGEINIVNSRRFKIKTFSID